MSIITHLHKWDAPDIEVVGVANNDILNRLNLRNRAQIAVYANSLKQAC